YEVETPKGLVRRNINTFIVDYETLDVFQMDLAAGRNLDPNLSTDLTQGYLVNEAAVAALGLENPVGAAMKVANDESEDGQIVGVVKDFHYRGLQSGIEPLAMW